jgi:uncharacterized membrane protein YkvA (DUF1232 family)
MELTKEQYEKAKKKFEEDIKNVDQNDVDYASKKGSQKVDEFGNNPPSALAKMWNDIKLMIGLIKDYTVGNYKEVPWDTIAAITGAIVYFISPIDLIPDFLPFIGYIDDALIITLALEFSSNDLAKYKKWKDAN